MIQFLGTQEISAKNDAMMYALSFVERIVMSNDIVVNGTSTKDTWQSRSRSNEN